MPKLSAYNTVTAPGTGDYIPLHNSGVSNSRIHPSSLFSSVLGYAGQSGKYFTTNGLSGSWIASTSLSVGGLSGYVQINNGVGGLTGHSSFVYSGGNVGIGVNQPLFPLHVSGTGYITRLDLVNLNILGEATGIFPFQGSSSGKILATNGTSTLWVPSGGAGANIPAGSNTQIQYNSGGAFAGSASFVFSGSGVGIGTFSPAANLDVRGRVYIDRTGALDFSNSNDCFFSIGNFYGQTGVGYGEVGIGIDNGGTPHIQTYGGKDLVIQDINNRIGFFGHPNAAFLASFANHIGPSGNQTTNFGSQSFKWLSGYFNFVDVVNLNVSGATTGIFPSQGSNSGKILATNGTSTLWVASGGAGGGGTPGGSTTHVQFNSGSTFSGNANFAWNYSTNRLGLGGISSGSGLLHLLPSSGVSGITISIASGQITNPFNIISTGNQLLGGFKSDGSILLHQNNNTSIISTNYKATFARPDSFTGSDNMAFVVERSQSANAQGQGVGIFLRDSSVYAGMRFWANGASQGTSDLEFFNQSAMSLRMPYGGGNQFFNPAANSQNTAVLEVQRQGLQPGGGHVDPASTVKITSANYTASSPLTLAECATVHISGAPTSGTNVTITKPYGLLINASGAGAATLLGIRGASGLNTNLFEIQNFQSGVVAAFTSSGHLSVSGSGYFNYLQAANLNITDSTTGIFPTQAGNSGRVLATNGTSTLWVVSGAGGGGTPGGSTTHVQFNSGGTFSGQANFVYNHSSVVPILSMSGSGSFNFVNVYSGISTPTSGIPNIGSITNPFNSGYFRTIYTDAVVVNSGFSGAAYTWPYYITWSFPSGIISGNSTNASYEIPVMRPCIFQSGAFCSARSKTAPSGQVGTSGSSGVIFDLNVNATGAVWTNKARRLTIADQSKYGSQTGFDHSGIINVGDYISIDIVNYPTGQYANDIVVQLMLMSQHP